MSLQRLFLATITLLKITESEAFSSLSVSSFRSQELQRLSHLSSTLSPDGTGVRSEDEENAPKRGAISMQIDELADYLGGKGRAQIVWDCYSIGIDPADYFGSIYLGYDDYETIMQLMPSMRRTQKLGSETLEKLAALYPQGGKVEGGVAKLSFLSKSSDSTTKLLLTLADGLQIETVIIPWKGQRSTLCVSSQVGCRHGKMGKLRSLTSSEILAQLFFAKKLCRLEGLPDITDIVFMGIGDAADNIENIIEATKIMTTRELFQLSASRVTVSTVGPSPEAFRAFAEAPCVIAWSVHAANDELRRQLVPTTKYTLEELREGLIEALLERPMNGRTVMLEVTLMKGINDSLKEAEELTSFAEVIAERVAGCKVMINLIPYNNIGPRIEIGQSEYQRPDEKNVVAFQKYLQGHDLFSDVRTTRGDDKTATCGQLATKKSNLK
mmetsp:Transcript_28176/g.68586  ORF Transcript_28176/g.68586 Transcript_28176/m.68586 type:complete len:440 (+) Transcript_28176:209-1528(+)|eukprot:CAMPEP_0113620932 /NCGR_PEP_ID=MMETSP0017_2-20120614/10679_1 /TAXON_ID=2856 /ORGANISM="Cylindrotheca closterium" /LENGTH=439 /DNA_ID=CAMNT_0000530631 /DNA_START=195 /DNA_END=1514 /DNA_ORIENTATION=- /assembly_acc=CAM_ASM_000147